MFLFVKTQCCCVVSKHELVPHAPFPTGISCLTHKNKHLHTNAQQQWQWACIAHQNFPFLKTLCCVVFEDGLFFWTSLLSGTFLVKFFHFHWQRTDSWIRWKKKKKKTAPPRRWNRRQFDCELFFFFVFFSGWIPINTSSHHRGIVLLKALSGEGFYQRFWRTFWQPEKSKLCAMWTHCHCSVRALAHWCFFGRFCGRFLAQHVRFFFVSFHLFLFF